MPTAVRGGAESLKGSHRMGGGQKLLIISAPLPLKRIFRMSPLLARSISMDSTFKPPLHKKSWKTTQILRIDKLWADALSIFTPWTNYLYRP
jgi:hypothetical protein